MRTRKDFYSFSSHLVRAFDYRTDLMGNLSTSSAFQAGFDSLEPNHHLKFLQGSCPSSAIEQIKGYQTFRPRANSSRKITGRPYALLRELDDPPLASRIPQKHQKSRREDSMSPHGAQETPQAVSGSDGHDGHESTVPLFTDEPLPYLRFVALERPSNPYGDPVGTDSNRIHGEAVAMESELIDDSTDTLVRAALFQSEDSNIGDEQEYPSNRRKSSDIYGATPHAESGVRRERDFAGGSSSRADEESLVEDLVQNTSAKTDLTNQTTRDVTPRHEFSHRNGGLLIGGARQQHPWPILCPCELFPVLFQAELEVQNETISSMCVHEVNKVLLWKTKEVGKNSYICYAAEAD